MARTVGAVGQKTMIAYIQKVLPEFNLEGLDKKVIKAKYEEMKTAEDKVWAEKALAAEAEG